MLSLIMSVVVLMLLWQKYFCMTVTSCGRRIDAQWGSRSWKRISRDLYFSSTIGKHIVNG